VSVIQFPNEKPPPEEILRFGTDIATIARAVSRSLHESTNAIVAANTAEELAAAVHAMHELLVTHERNFGELVDATRPWR
jgi:hypothetical protein